MRMASRSNSMFRHDDSLSSVISRHRHAVNFHWNASSEMVPMGPYFGRNEMNMINIATNLGLIRTGYSSNSSLDSVSGVKLETSMASEWSNQEQYKLQDGLEKYKDKPSIVKYIKIGGTLPDKTVRDVALRCRWMIDKQAELSTNSSISSVLSDNMAAYPFLSPITSSRKNLTCEDYSRHAISIIEQNVRACSQIKANLSSYKVEDNIDLFRHTRNNLITIQNDMNNMPGLISHMPPLRVAINDDLANAILNNTTLAMPFNTMQSGGYGMMKQEPLG